jgi:hypothetical protein
MKTRISPVRAVLCALGLSVAAVATVGCGDTVQATSACSNIDSPGGQSRSAFLPCAGELLTALDQLAPLSHAALKGNKQSRLEGEAALRHLLPMMNEAGGERLLDRSSDGDLSDLRMEIHNAVARYRHYYAIAIPPEYHPQAARARQEAQWELDRAARHYNSARNLYRELHGG